MYFVFIDTILFSQFSYYSIKNRGKKAKSLTTESSALLSKPGGPGVASPNVVIGTPVHGTGASETTRLLSGASPLSTVTPPGMGTPSIPFSTVHSTVNSMYSTSASQPGVPAANATRLHSIFVFLALGLLTTASLALEPSSLAARVASPGGRVLLMHTSGKTINIIGTILAWSSAAFYLGSRTPQIVKNFRRRSTDGLSLAMFFFAVMGNLFYAVSIFLNTHGWHEYRNRLPYIIGSIGTLCFDFTIFTQFQIYKGNVPAEVTEIDPEVQPLPPAPANNTSVPAP